jgi:hypothetical protein
MDLCNFVISNELDLICAILIILFIDGPKALQLLIPPSAPQQPHLVPASPPSQSYNAYDSLYHMGKKEYFNTNNILRDEYSQRINLYSPNISNPYQRV